MQSTPRPSRADTAQEPATAEEAVMTAMITLGRRMRQRQPEDEIDFSALPVLKTLAHHGPLRLSALAGQLELDASTVSRHARHLEDRGLLERTDDPQDGRASQVGLSEHGRACLERGAASRRAIIGAALAPWSEADREQLRVLLNRLHHDLDTSQHPQENP